jgi:hypothetical protein
MDFCCGTTMTARLGPLCTEGRAQLTDVPFLVCPTCGHTTVAPAVEFDVTMYLHYCETDGVAEASLLDVVDREKIQAILDDYPDTDLAMPRVSDEQIDHMLDLWNFALALQDVEWVREIREKLVLLHRVRSEQRQLQEQR